MQGCPRERDGNPFRCGCSERESLKDAERIVRLGRGRWKIQRRSGGGLIVLHDEIVMLRVEWRTARTISGKDIEAAYIENQKCARARIEATSVHESEVEQMATLMKRRDEAIDEIRRQPRMFLRISLAIQGIKLSAGFCAARRPFGGPPPKRIAAATAFVLSLSENSPVTLIAYHNLRPLRPYWIDSRKMLEDETADKTQRVKGNHPRKRGLLVNPTNPRGLQWANEAQRKLIGLEAERNTTPAEAKPRADKSCEPGDVMKSFNYSTKNILHAGRVIVPRGESQWRPKPRNPLSRCLCLSNPIPSGQRWPQMASPMRPEVSMVERPRERWMGSSPSKPSPTICT